MTIKDVIDKIGDAVQSISGLNFRCCFLYELGENESYPLGVLIPPKGESLFHSDMDTYDIELWILKLLPQSSTDDKDDVWKTLTGYGWTIIKYLYNTTYEKSGEEYYLLPVKVEFEPVNSYGKDKAPAMVFKFKMEAKNCK